MAIQPPWFPRAGQVPQAGLTPQQFQDLQALFLGLGNPACPLLRVCGTPVNGYYPVWNGTTNQANWAASPSTLVGLVDGPGTYAGAANYFVKIDSLGTGFVFSPLVLSFLALSDAPTPATYVGNALKGIRVNAAENRLEFYTTGAGTGDFVGPASAIDGSIVLFDGPTGKLGKQGPELSLGGNDVADAGKVPLFGTEGQLFGSAVSSAQAAITGSATASGVGGRFTSSGGNGVDISVSGPGGKGITASTQSGQAAQFLLTGVSVDPQLYVRRIAGLASAGILATFIGSTNLALTIGDDGGITWTGTTGRDTTRTSLGLGTAAYLAAATTSTANAIVQALATGKIDTSFLPDSVLGQMEYQGVWDGATNTPAIPASSAANKGWFYIVSVGVAAGHGYANIPDIPYDVGDWIASSGVGWDKIDNTDAVVSFNSRIGAILPAAGDYTATQITNTPAGNIAAVTVQAALNELDTEKERNIVAGTTAQYWRGDKSWRDFFTDVRAATLTGLSLAVGGVIAAADTVLVALGKLQNQLTATAAVANSALQPGDATDLFFIIRAATPFVWTNQAAAIDFFQAIAATSIVPVNLTKKSRIMIYGYVSVIGHTTSKLIVKYKTGAWSATVGDYSDVGVTEVSIPITATGYVDSGWIDITGSAKAQVFVAVTGSGGNIVLDPSWNILGVVAE
jgi:hypothetical protein